MSYLLRQYCEKAIPNKWDYLGTHEFDYNILPNLIEL